MGVTVAVTRAALNTSTGTQSFTTTDCGGLTPKAAMFFLTKGVTDGTKANHGAIAIGATDGTRQWCVGIQAEDAAATTAVDRFAESDHCVAIQTVAGAIEGSAAFSAWVTNGITINIDDAFPAGYLLTVVFYCGTDLTAYAMTQDMGNTIDLETNITAPGFQPNLVFAASSITTTMDTVVTNALFSFGVAHESGGTVTQRCVNMRQEDGQAVVTMSGRLSTLYGIADTSSAGAITWGGEFANFDSSGCSIFTRIAGGGNRDIGLLFLNFGGVASSWVGTVASPTATGSAAITAPGFKPQFVMQGLSMVPAVNTAYIDDNANLFGVGMMTTGAQFSNALWDDDAAADSNSECISDNIPIAIQNGVDGTGLVASFTSFDTNGWTVNYSDVEASAKQSWAVAIQEVSTSTIIILDTASIAATGRAIDAIQGAVSKLLDTASLIASGIHLTVIAIPNVLITLDTAVASANGRFLDIVPGAISKLLDTSNLSAVGRSFTVVKGGAIIQVDTSSIIANGIQLDVTTITTLLLDTSVINANGNQIDIVPGLFSLLLDNAMLSANGKTISILSSGAINLDTATLMAAGNVIDIVTGAMSLSIDTALLNSTGRIIDIIPGTKFTLLDTPLLVSSGNNIDIVPGTHSITLDMASLLAIGNDIDIIPGTRSIILDHAIININGQIIVISSGDTPFTILLAAALLQSTGRNIDIVTGGVILPIDTASILANSPDITISNIMAIVRAWTLFNRTIQWKMKNRSTDWTLKEDDR